MIFYNCLFNIRIYVFICLLSGSYVLNALSEKAVNTLINDDTEVTDEEKTFDDIHGREAIIDNSNPENINHGMVFENGESTKSADYQKQTDPVMNTLGDETTEQMVNQNAVDSSQEQVPVTNGLSEQTDDQQKTDSVSPVEKEVVQTTETADHQTTVASSVEHVLAATEVLGQTAEAADHKKTVASSIEHVPVTAEVVSQTAEAADHQKIVASSIEQGSVTAEILEQNSQLTNDPNAKDVETIVPQMQESQVSSLKDNQKPPVVASEIRSHSETKKPEIVSEESQESSLKNKEILQGDASGIETHSETKKPEIVSDDINNERSRNALDNSMKAEHLSTSENEQIDSEINNQLFEEPQQQGTETLVADGMLKTESNVVGEFKQNTEENLNLKMNIASAGTDKVIDKHASMGIEKPNNDMDTNTNIDINSKVSMENSNEIINDNLIASSENLERDFTETYNNKPSAASQLNEITSDADNTKTLFNLPADKAITKPTDVNGNGISIDGDAKATLVTNVVSNEDGAVTEASISSEETDGYCLVTDESCNQYAKKGQTKNEIGDGIASSWMICFFDNLNTTIDYIVQTLKPAVTFIIDMLPSSIQVIFLKAPFNIDPVKAFILFVVFLFLLFTAVCRITIQIIKMKKIHHQYLQNIELLSNLQQQLLVYNQESSDLDKMKSEFEGSSKTLSDESIKLNEKLQKLTVSKDKLEATTTEQRNQIKDLTKQLKAQTALVNEHIKTNKQVQNKLDDATKHSSLVENQLHENQLLLQKSQSSCLELQSQLQSQTEELNLLQNYKEQMVTDARNWNEKIEDLVEQKTLLKLEAENLNAALDEKNNQVKNLEVGLKELQLFEVQLSSLSSEATEDADGGDNNRQQRISNCMQSLLDVAQVRNLYTLAKDENELLKKEFSVELETRLKLVDKVKVLQENISELERAKEDAEEKVKTTNVKMEVLHNYFKEKETDLTRELGEQKVKEKYTTDNLLNKDDLVKDMQQNISDLKLREMDLQNELKATTANYNKQIAQFEKSIHEVRIDLMKAQRESLELKNLNAHLNLQLLDAQNKLKVADEASSVPSNSAAMTPPIGDERPPSLTFPSNSSFIPPLRMPHQVPRMFLERGFPAGMHPPPFRPMLPNMHRIPLEAQWRVHSPKMRYPSPPSSKNGRHSTDYTRQPQREYSPPRRYSPYSPVRDQSPGSPRRRGSGSPDRRSFDSPRNRSPDSREGSYSPRGSPYSPRRGRSPDSPRRRSSFSPRERYSDSPRRERSPDSPRRGRFTDSPTERAANRRQRSKSQTNAYKKHNGKTDGRVDSRAGASNASSPPLHLPSMLTSPPRLQDSYDSNAHDHIQAPVPRRGERRNV